MNAKTICLVLGAVLMASLFGGCSGGPGKYNVTVTPAAGMREGGRFPSFEVDVVGVNQTDADRLKSYSVNDYFSGGDPVRKDSDAKTMSFTAAKSEAQTLSMTDPVWDKWLSHGATQLVIMANIPGVSGDKGEDRRRLILPLLSKRWEGHSIEIEVQRSGVVCRTPMKPE